MENIWKKELLVKIEWHTYTWIPNNFVQSVKATAPPHCTNTITEKILDTDKELDELVTILLIRKNNHLVQSIKNTENQWTP